MGPELFRTQFRLAAESGLAQGQAVLRHEGRALLALADRLDAQFDRAVDRICDCSGSVLVTGIGKAGLIGRKISATLASLGIRSHFLHPVEALHGDLGCLTAGDMVLALSFSGETEELVRLAGLLAERQVELLSVTASRQSRLGAASAIVLELGRVAEAGLLKLAPTTSTTLMLGLGDALALVAAERRGFAAADFARNHPGGNLGRRLARVEEIMRPLSACRIARDDATVREVFTQRPTVGRRTGAVMLVDDSGRLTGLFTDSDLARLLERKHDAQLDGPIRDVMTRHPQTIALDAWLADAVEILAARKISELPVVNSDGLPVGLIDITDVLADLPPVPTAPNDAAAHAANDARRMILPFEPRDDRATPP
ncbi:MAG: KpsF/GutQ family sugar-phosphate isomerase [Planctomycetes bacterium]|nr:KpsF/GutQ family sugar-phosphate isomerase [Planctomycetota bacterium]